MGYIFFFSLCRDGRTVPSVRKKRKKTDTTGQALGILFAFVDRHTSMAPLSLSSEFGYAVAVVGASYLANIYGEHWIAVAVPASTALRGSSPHGGSPHAMPRFTRPPHAMPRFTGSPHAMPRFTSGRRDQGRHGAEEVRHQVSDALLDRHHQE